MDKIHGTTLELCAAFKKKKALELGVLSFAMNVVLM
jgi:hypothetical protein